MWQTITAVAIPLLGVLGALLSGGGTRLSKRIAHHADLLPKLDGATEATAALHALLAKEIAWLDERESRRYRRKINRRNAGLALGAASITAGTGSLLLAWVTYLADVESGWLFPAIFITSAVLALGVVITGTYSLRIFDPTRSEQLRQLAREALAQSRQRR